MNRLGVMQGRLTNKGGFFPQQFPSDKWEQEFFIASEIGFGCIEWMFNYEQWELNPLISLEGVNAIRKLSDRTGVVISGICANYFMHRNIFAEDLAEKNKAIVYRLVESAIQINCKNIIIPLFEASEEQVDIFKLKTILEQVSCKDVNILLETNYELELINEWFQEYTIENIGICYDIGNAIGLGRNVVYEIEKYSSIIKNVHIKDKKMHGTTVMLGQGDAPIEKAIKVLCDKNYLGCFILESYYNVDAINDTRKNYSYIKDLLL